MNETPQTAAVPAEWEADIERPAAAQFCALRGETLALRCRLVRRRKPYALPAGATARLWYTALGVDTGGWWSAPAAVDPDSGLAIATWTPQMDCDAQLYTCYIQISAGGAANYRALCTMRMLQSPGSSPNRLPLPAPTIDFATVEALNPPWLPAAALAGWDPPAPTTLRETAALLATLIAKLKNNPA